MSATQNSQRFVSDSVSTLVDKQASIIQSALQVNLDTARALARSFETLKIESAGAANGADLRSLINRMLLQVLEDNTAFLGAYTAWEPNAVDPNDRGVRGAVLRRV